PGAGARLAAGPGLGERARVVGADEVGPAAVDVALVAQVLGAHHRALEVPAGEARAPGAVPAHDVARLGLLPHGEVAGVVLVRAHLAARALDELVGVPAGELAVRLVARDVEVDVAAPPVGVPRVDELLHELDLLGDVTRRARDDARAADVHRRHRVEVAPEVLLGDLHRLQALELRPPLQLVLALLVVGEVPDVGDVRDEP